MSEVDLKEQALQGKDKIKQKKKKKKKKYKNKYNK